MTNDLKLTYNQGTNLPRHGGQLIADMAQLSMEAR